MQKTDSSEEFTFNISVKEDPAKTEKFLQKENPDLLQFNHTPQQILDMTDKVIADNLA